MRSLASLRAFALACGGPFDSGTCSICARAPETSPEVQKLAIYISNSIPPLTGGNP